MVVQTKHPKLIFIHIPKTAGSSVSSALGRLYRFSRFHVKASSSWRVAERVLDRQKDKMAFETRLHQFRSDLLVYAAENGARFLSGHVWYTEQLRSLQLDGYQVLTCLRDPVDRFLSHYLYNRYNERDHTHTTLDFESFLKTERAKHFGTIYLKYIGGYYDSASDENDMIVNAKASIDCIDGIGFVESGPSIFSEASRLVNKRVNPRHRRLSPAKHSAKDALIGNEDLMNEVKKICKPDIEIYNYALRRQDDA